MSIRKLATLSGCQKSKVERWLSRDYPDSAPDTCSLVGIVVQLAAHQKKIDKMLAIKALEAKIAKAQQDLNSEDSE